MTLFFITELSFWLGVGITSVLAVVLWMALKTKRTEDWIRKNADLDHLKQQTDHLTENLLEKDQTIQNLREENTRLATTLQHEQKSVQNQIKTLEKTKEELGHLFKSLGQEALQLNNKTFLDLAKENFEKKQSAIENLVKPVSESLEKMDQKIHSLEKERQGAYEGLKQHLKSMAEDQGKLRSETAHLVQALRSPSSKGRWGEMHLKNTVKMAGLLEHVDFVEQDSFQDDTGKIKRPDMVVNMPGGQRIVVDAKTPIDAYYDALTEEMDGAEREQALDRLARLVKEHIKMLSSKAYWDQFESPEFVVMFLPSEGILSTAVERDPSLLQFGIEQKVIPASPTTLVALLRAVAYGWKQEKIADNARDIADLGGELYKRLATFGDHLQKVGKGLGHAMDNYNKAVGSLENSVLPSARKFNDLHVTSKTKEIPPLTVLDQQPRSLSAPEFKGNDKKKA